MSAKDKLDVWNIEYIEDEVDYESNRFVFKGFLKSICEKCKYELANMLDKQNLEDKIEYCFNCKRRYNGKDKK